MAELTPVLVAQPAQVEGEIEIYLNGRTREEVEKEILGRGLSPSYSDGGFTLYPENFDEVEPILISFDAYKTNDVEIYFEGRSLVEKIDWPVTFQRIRRHAAFGVAAWVSLGIANHLLDKFLDDVGLYETLKDGIVGKVHGGDAGKEFRITAVGKVINKSHGEAVVHFKGTDSDVRKMLDDEKTKNLLRQVSKEADSPELSGKHVVYTVAYQGSVLVIKKIEGMATGTTINITG